MASPRNPFVETIKAQPVFHADLQNGTRMFYTNLWIELRHKRTVLIRKLTQDESRSAYLEPLSALADQALFVYEQELAILGKVHLRNQLRGVDRAISFMEQGTYGYCVCCRLEIPIARLRVQPAALHCAICLTLDEQNRGSRKTVSHAH